MQLAAILEGVSRASDAWGQASRKTKGIIRRFNLEICRQALVDEGALDHVQRMQDVHPDVRAFILEGQMSEAAMAGPSGSSSGRGKGVVAEDSDDDVDRTDEEEPPTQTVVTQEHHLPEISEDEPPPRERPQRRRQQPDKYTPDTAHPRGGKAPKKR